MRRLCRPKDTKFETFSLSYDAPRSSLHDAAQSDIAFATPRTNTVTRFLSSSSLERAFFTHQRAEQPFAPKSGSGPRHEDITLHLDSSSEMQLILAIIAAFATLVTAQNASTPSVNLFLPTPFQNTIQFAASVLGACNGETTYGVRCTAGVMAPRFTCNPDTPVCPPHILTKDEFQLTVVQEFTVTEASNFYKATRTSPISSAIMTITETCSLRDTHEASCTVDIVITGGGQVTSRSTSSILTGTDIPSYYMYIHLRLLNALDNELTTCRYQIPVTGGADVLHATGSVCASSGATRTTAPFVFGALLGLFVFTAAVVL